jgi:hypothetical protein
MTAPIVIETVRKDNAVDRPNALTRLRTWRASDFLCRR